MKISYVSDLHCEFGIKNLELPGGDVLLLAGDIVVVRGLVSTGQHYEQHVDKGRNHVFHKLMKEQFSKYKNVFAIMGNHEHYGYEMLYTLQHLREQTAEYSFLKILEDQVVELTKGWKLFASTMWTDYNHYDIKARSAADMGMNDHRYIRFNDYTFTTDDAYNLNQKSRSALAKALEDNPEDQFVIMTHHTPSMKSSHPKWGKERNLLNYAFSNVDLLEPMVDEYPLIKYWVHGHTHDSMDYMYKDCRVLCNPKGYGNENLEFDPTKSFEI